MVIRKINPVGVDIPLDSYQVWFYGMLKKRFGLNSETDPTDSAFDLYSRAHRNPRDDGFSAEVLGANGEYIDVLFNDKKVVGQGFWIEGERVEYRLGYARAKVAMILQFNLQGITGAEYNPMHDEQVNRDVMSIIHQPRYGFTFTALVKGIDNIFKEYPKWKDSVKFSDMYPWHCLRLEFDLNYNIDACFGSKF